MYNSLHGIRKTKYEETIFGSDFHWCVCVIKNGNLYKICTSLPRDEIKMV